MDRGGTPADPLEGPSPPPWKTPSVAVAIEPRIDRPALAARVGELCRLTGEFTLRSGQVASTYFDKYLFEADPEILAAIAAHMAKLVPDTTEVVAGLELGGGPRRHGDLAGHGDPGGVRPEGGQDLWDGEARRPLGRYRQLHRRLP